MLLTRLHTYMLLEQKGAFSISYSVSFSRADNITKSAYCIPQGRNKTLCALNLLAIIYKYIFCKSDRTCEYTGRKSLRATVVCYLNINL
jgi:hypothetical protein